MYVINAAVPAVAVHLVRQQAAASSDSSTGHLSGSLGQPVTCQ